MRNILVIVAALGLTACGDDSTSSTSNRPKPRKNSKKKAAKKAKKAAFSTYNKVDADLRRGLQEIDFVPDSTSRDPFRSWVATLGDDSEPEVIEKIDPCATAGNGVEWEARNFSIRALTLIGFVKRGRSLAQFTDKGEGNSWIVRKGDCLGQEKAIVEEITVGIVRLVITPPAPAGRAAPPAQTQIISLHPAEEREIDSSIINRKTRDLR